MDYNLTDAQRKILERGMEPARVDTFVHEAMARGGPSNVEAKIAVFSGIPVDYRRERANEYRKSLAKNPADALKFEVVTGDILDTIIAQLAVLVGEKATPEFTDLLAKIAAVKQKIPKT